MPFETILRKIVNDSTLHKKWLNTLSYLENCGAKKIALCEHPVLVKKEMLKHAAEEFRHAYLLKMQMDKICNNEFFTYQVHSILGGRSTVHYLDKLEIRICKYLKQKRLFTPDLAYLAVTYCIEKRAQYVYPLYQKILKESFSKISVKSILMEEEHHLAEIEEALKNYPQIQEWIHELTFIEEGLFQNWMQNL